MLIQDILFLGEEDGDVIRQVAMAIWEEMSHFYQGLATDVKYPAQDPQWNNNLKAHQEHEWSEGILSLEESGVNHQIPIHGFLNNGKIFWKDNS